MASRPPRVNVSSWQVAERNAAAWMRWLGYEDADVTGPGSDGGVDIRSSEAAAQVKYEAIQVGRPALQRLVGATHKQDLELYFFTGSGYSRPAVLYAEEHEIALFVYDTFGGVTPCSLAARIACQIAERVGGFG